MGVCSGDATTYPMPEGGSMTGSRGGRLPGENILEIFGIRLLSDSLKPGRVGQPAPIDPSSGAENLGNGNFLVKVLGATRGNIDPNPESTSSGGGNISVTDLLRILINIGFGGDPPKL
jgi:hypothetical protein